jgi:hypothetical protein
MKRFKMIPTIALMIGLMFALWSSVEAQTATINGQDVAQPTDTVINPPVYGSNIKGRLLDSGISFILMENHTSGMKDRVTVFKPESVDTICGWEAALTKDIAIVFNGSERYCSE